MNYKPTIKPVDGLAGVFVRSLTLGDLVKLRSAVATAPDHERDAVALVHLVSLTACTEDGTTMFDTDAAMNLPITVGEKIAKAAEGLNGIDPEAAKNG